MLVAAYKKMFMHMTRDRAFFLSNNKNIIAMIDINNIHALNDLLASRIDLKKHQPSLFALLSGVQL